MRITYRQMVQMMNATFTNEQWDSDVTVENCEVGEFFPASLRIIGNNDALDENHPVIFINYESQERATDYEIRSYIHSANTK